MQTARVGQVTGSEIYASTTFALSHVRLRPVTEDRILFAEGTLLTMINPDGSNKVEFTGYKFGAWAPDGNSIYAVSTGNQIDQLGLDGTPITSGIYDGSLGAGIGSIDVNAAGTAIAITYGPTGWTRVYTMNIDGTGATAITPNLASTRNVRWSPDGSILAYEGVNGTDRDILVINADGTGETNLTNDPLTVEQNPTFRFDGSIVYASNGAAGSALNLMAADGSSKAVYFNDPGVEETYPAIEN